tara:strand:- start:2200 stop:2643 length:444 start_codon:yes stop_codon:yes gene_type:complete
MAVKVVSGSSLIIKIDESNSPSPGSETAIGGSTSGTLSITQETIDITNKESNGRKQFLNGVSSWTVDCDALFTQGSSNAETINPATLYTALDNGNRVHLEFTTTDTTAGANTYSGYGFITSLSMNAAVGEWATYSVSIQGDGQLTKS